MKAKMRGAVDPITLGFILSALGVVGVLGGEGKLDGKQEQPVAQVEQAQPAQTTTPPHASVNLVRQ